MTEAARLAELDRLGALEAGGDRDLQALVDLAAQVCRVPKVAINLISGDQQHQVAASGFDPGICSRDDSMCAAVLEVPTPVVVPDATQDSRFASNPFVTGEIGEVRFYASAPLVTREGLHIGRLCVFDDVPHEGLLGPETLTVLTVLAARVVDILELRLRSAELERALAALTLTRAELDRSNASLAAFAEQVSHDLRNSLTGVLASVELLAGEPGLDEGARQLLDSALGSGRRMSALIDGSLELARAGAPSPGGAARLSSVVAEVAADLGLGLAAATVEVTEDAELPLDPRLLHAVLLNLVGNAVKFTRPLRAPRVTVAGRRTASGWRVEVADNGPGVPAADRERVLERCVRLASAVEGTGIGLASVRRIVTDLGGSVALDEAPGGGLLVRVDLPA